jgi:Phage capsid family
MAGFDDFMSRTDAAGELPVQLAQDLINATIRVSTMLTLARKVPTTTRDSRVPVLSELPDAAWISAGAPANDVDMGLKQTTKAVFENQPLIAEELAAIAVIPNSVVEDSQFPLWSAVQPLLARAIARRYDDACMFGNGAPTTFPPSLVAQATAAGNVITGPVTDPDTDLPALVLRAAQAVSEMGYNITGTAVAPGWQYRAAAQRTPALVANPIGAASPFPLLLGGMGIKVDPLRWDRSQCDSITAAWDMVLVGLRQDIRLEVFNTGVLSDATGKVTINLLQQDAQAVRATFRAGFLTVNPPTDYVGPPDPCPVAIVVDGPDPETPLSAGSHSKK